MNQKDLLERSVCWLGLLAVAGRETLILLHGMLKSRSRTCFPRGIHAVPLRGQGGMLMGLLEVEGEAGCGSMVAVKEL